jgi:hypothetical protein
MPVHLLKMAVGATDLDHLQELQTLRRSERGMCCFYTRNMPRRRADVLDGGSIYWVIKGQVRARQRLLGITPTVGADGERYCIVEYEPRLVATLWQPRRPFQGWRYLEPGDAPSDRPAGAAIDDEMPPAMARELRALGLL